MTPPGARGLIPIDLYAKTRAARLPALGLALPERYRSRNRLLAELGGNPDRLDKALLLHADSTEPPHVVVSDTLCAGMQAAKLKVVRGRAARLDHSAVILEDGRRLAADAIVWCTGYRPELSFVDPKVRRLVEHDPADLLQPLLLADSVFPAGLRGLSFVGMYRGPYFSGIELQARWACAVISGAVPPPSRTELAAGIRSARRIRTARPRPQFPHDDLVLADTIARRVGALPPAEESPGLGEWFWNSPVVPAHYRMLGPHSEPEIAARQVMAATARCREAGGLAS